MKIAFTFFDWPGYTGGPLVNAKRLLPEFQKNGHEVHALIKFRITTSSKEYLEHNGIQCHIFEDPFYTKKELSILLNLLEEIQPDIFVSNISVAGCFAAKFLRLSGIPTINTHRSNDPVNWGRAIYFSNKNNPFHSSACVCVSDYLKDELKSKVTETVHLETIPSGVPFSKFITNQNEETHLGFIYAGRLEDKQKNILVITDIFIDLSKIYKNYFFTIMGSGSMLEEIKEKVFGANAQTQIAIVPPCQGAEYKKELARHHFFLLFSDYEGVPGSVMDAMSCGLIPLVKSYQGIDELIENEVTGYIFNSKPELINQMRYILKRRQEVSRNALNKISKSLSLDYCVNKWLALFEKLYLTEGGKKRFIAPNYYKLPQTVNNLPEYRIPPNISKRLFAWIKENTIKIIKK